ncbi:hypothetical protein C8R45DRAFT_1208688 [Mycena sanguinolenta]|nr:hypothetical protein C8R45DRAFT_1208688 [Mycena sanguinolenta]
MHPLVGYFAVLAFIAQLSPLCHGTWTPGKAVAIQFYNGSAGDGCAQYIGDATIWWTSSPLASDNGSLTGAGCDLLNWYGDTTGINITVMWGQSTMSDTVEPAQANGGCTFWSEVECGIRHSVSVAYLPGEAGSCQAASDQGGLFVEECEMLYRRSRYASPTFVIDFGFGHHLGEHDIWLDAPDINYSRSLSSAAIAGVTTSAVSLVVIFLATCMWRRNRQKPAIILPYLQMLRQHGPEAPRQSSVPQVSEKSAGNTVFTVQSHHPRSATLGERLSRQSLVAGELREEVGRLNSALANGDGYDVRIRALERELQAYGDAERPDP